MEREIITSRKNPVIGEYRRIAAERAYRGERGLCLGQGGKLLEEALGAGRRVVSVLTPRPLDLDPSIRQYLAAPALLEYASPMKSAPEVLFLCDLPEPGEVRGDRLLLAEDLQDPGNVGTLIRTANAFGMDGVILAGSCADPFGPKAVRASMGAVYRRPVWSLPAEEALAALRELGMPLIAAALGESARSLGEYAFPARLCLAVGNEGHGLSEAVIRAAETVVRIPMEPGAESLNAAAAAAVLMWEVYKSR